MRIGISGGRKSASWVGLRCASTEPWRDPCLLFPEARVAGKAWADLCFHKGWSNIELLTIVTFTRFPCFFVFLLYGCCTICSGVPTSEFCHSGFARHGSASRIFLVNSSWHSRLSFKYNFHVSLRNIISCGSSICITDMCTHNSISSLMVWHNRNIRLIRCVRAWPRELYSSTWHLTGPPVHFVRLLFENKE